MKPTKKIENDILAVSTNYWESYFSGNWKKTAAFLDDNIKLTGSTENELFVNKKEVVAFLKASTSEVANKLQMKNRTAQVHLISGLVLLHEYFDLYVTLKEEWNFYSKFRVTSVLKQTPDGWKYLQQHGSIPDSKTEGDETVAIEKISKENLELRDAVKRRTFELEAKNRALEVETALERIRSRVSAMQQSSDLFDIVVTMRNEFISLGHEADYFWHMKWTEDNYEMSMTAEDGSRLGMVITVPKFVHDNIPSLAIWEKSKKPTFVLALDADAAWDYIDNMNTHGKYQQVDPHAPTQEDIAHTGGLTFVIARTTHGEIGYSLPGVVNNPPAEDLKILERFASVFDLAHRRFLDLQKTEKQAREVEIELAIERVRSCTMAMQHSDELQETSFLLDQQVRALGIKTWGCAFNIYGEKESKEWFGNEAGVLPTYTVPRTGIFKKYYDKGQKGKTLWIEEFSGKACVKHYETMSALPVIGDVLLQLKETNNGFPTYQLDHVVFFKYGYLLFITKEPVPDAHDIFKRFAKVFEQTYTRFLDLQKAEAQAKEAQIEAALERVRAKSMAMQSSDELETIIQVVHDQFVDLGVTLDHAGFIIDYKTNEDMVIWLADEHKVTPQIRLPYFDSPHWNSYILAKEKGHKLFVNHLNFNLKNKFYNEIFKYVPELPEEAKAFYLQIPSLTIATALVDTIGLYIENFSGVQYNEMDQKILLRFAEAFQQTYTRFLDLQKAEAQAREALIEASLERVRARSLAMHHSDELLEVVHLMFDEFRSLGVKTDIVGIRLRKEESKDMHFWMGTADGFYDKLLHWPYKDIRIFNDIHKAQVAGEVMNFTFSQEETKEFLDAFFKVKDVPNERKAAVENNTEMEWLFSLMNNSGIFIMKYKDERFSSEEKDILSRYSRVFEQTYIRFLDLQKAEAQTREAQIEAALERVRSASMAMHKSDELEKVVEVTFQQLQSLSLSLDGCQLITFEGQSKNLHFWSATPDMIYPTRLDIPFFDHPIFSKFWEARERKDSFISFDLSRQETLDFYNHLYDKTNLGATVTKERWGKIQSIENGFKTSWGIQKNTGIWVFNFSNHQFTKEENSLIDRFAKVFEQTYTRFLDLQKAEAQAREAQIEAALEKVRSRSLAMHKPEELQEVVTIVAEKLKDLGVIFDAGGVILCTYFPDNKDVMHWIAADDFSYSGNYLVPYFENPIFDNAWDSKMRGDAYFSEEFSVEVKNNFFTHCFENSDYKNFPDEFKQHALQAKQHHLSAAWSKNSAIIIPSFAGVTPSEHDAEILKRFSKVFEQAYIRFMDLQRAEAQAREAQIETALEKVRSRSLAMQKSGELLDVIGIVSEQLHALRLKFDTICFGESNKDGAVKFWLTSKGLPKPILVDVPPLKNILVERVVKAQKDGLKFLADVVIGKTYTEWNNHMLTNSQLQYLPEAAKTYLAETSGFARSSFFLKEIALYVMNYKIEPYSEADNAIFNRFAQVFDQSYTRFLDLKKAEAQAREAQIENALEKVRSRTMAMQSSDELAEAAQVLFSEVQGLGIPSWSCGYNLLADDNKTAQAWMSSEGIIQEPFTLEFKKEPSFIEMYDFFEGTNSFLVQELGGKALKSHYTYMKSIPSLRERFENFEKEGIALPSYQINHLCKFSKGYLLFITYENVPEAHDIFKRFTSVFEQTYTRFLDLKRAEAQAREAQIEAALERVRSQSMGMQSTADFAEVTTEMFNQLRNFGEDLFATGIVFCDKHDGHVEQWHSIPGGGMLSPMIVPIDLDYIHQYRYDQWKAGTELFSIEIPSDFIEKHFEDIFKLPSAQITLEDLKSRNAPMPETPPWEIDYGASFKHGYILASSLKPLKNMDILPRFAKVFEQAYIRFLDLQKAEIREREATKQASLDRVRAEIASMRNALDLQRITPLIWNELTTLGVPFFRCGVMIVNEDTGILDFYLSNPEGQALAALHLDFDNSAITKNGIDYWRRKEVYIEHWDQKQFTAFMVQLMSQGQIEDTTTYQGGDVPPTSLTLQFVPFTQGMVYVGSEEALSTEELELVEALGKSLSVAYARYEDFTKLDLAKAKAEKALSDLKSVQGQLIQSEKMASLGELTAGIAHEIQNPLNFVNNFSDVSKELLEEMLEEMENGDLEEAKAIMDDVVQNLDKINHHGKRADGIVKGMLQHSRAGGDKKEATDINELADEYLRLAYHGLRAKDKTFNAELITDFDETVGEIDVIPQDIGRVMLNLITNAFYAVNEKKNSTGDSFKPTVSVKTIKEKEIIRIAVTDNGDGIPKKIRDKIFQPFFTTKPTGQGTGLGLSMSYDIMTKGHGGELTVASEEGEGTTFMISLPIQLSS